MLDAFRAVEDGPGYEAGPTGDYPGANPGARSVRVRGIFNEAPRTFSSLTQTMRR